MTIGAHFDGRVFVPDGPIDLPVGHRVRVVAESDASPELESTPPEVRDFCTAHDLAGPVAQLRQLARDHMSGVTGTDLWVQTDPESGESWLVVEARVAATLSTVLVEYKALLGRWIEATAPRVRDLVRFTFTLS
jgi:hypothetical protein